MFWSVPSGVITLIEQHLLLLPIVKEIKDNSLSKGKFLKGCA